MSNEHSTDNLTDQEDAGTALRPGNLVPGTGQNVCRICQGTGLYQGKPCRDCGGSGAVVDGMGAGGV